MSKLNPVADAEFRALARQLATDEKKQARRKRKLDETGLEVDPDLFALTPSWEEDESEDDDSNSLYIRDYTRPGPLFATIDPRDVYDFLLEFADLGSGVVDTRAYRNVAAATFTRASTATTVLSNGYIGTVAINAPRSYYDPASFTTNEVLASGDLTNASYWHSDNSGTGSAATCTAGFGDPLGGQTAFRVTANRGAGATGADYSLWNNYATSFPAGTYTNSIWIKSNTGANQNVLLKFASAASTDVVTATPTWQRLSNTATLLVGSGANQYCIGCRSTVGDTLIDVLVWRPQRNTGTTAASYVETTTKPASGFGTYRKYLREGTRINLCLQSEDFTNASWVKANATVGADAFVAPDGNQTADTFKEDNTTNNHFIQQTFVKAAAALPYTYSTWVRANDRRYTEVALDDGAGNGAYVIVDTAAGVISTAATLFGAGWTAQSATITPYPSGWYRVALTATSNSAVALRALKLSNTDGVTHFQSFAGTTGSGFYMWGDQLEQASFASSYIPTTTLAVTRNLDKLNYSVQPWINLSSGVLAVTFNPLSADGVSLSQDLATFSTATGYGTGNGYLVRLASSTSVDAGGNLTGVARAGSYLVGQTSKAAGRYQVSGALMNVSANGVLGVEAATLDFTGVGTVQLNVGTLKGDDIQGYFGTIAQVSYSRQYPSDAAFAALTAA